MSRGCIGVVVVAALAAAAPASAAGLALTAADVPGLKAAGKGAGVARSALGVGVPAALRGVTTEGAAFKAAGRTLSVGVFLLPSAAKARRALRAVRAGGKRVSVGNGGFRRVKLGKRRTDAVVVFRVGRAVGAVRLTARGRAGGAAGAALTYAGALADNLRRELATTAWQRTLEGIAADGSVSAQLALRAFAIAYGPLPGVSRPKGNVGTPEDATLAMTLVARVWDQLTSAQQAAIDRALGAPHDASSPPLARAAADPNLTADAGYQALVDDYANKYRAKLPGAPPVAVKAFKADADITTGGGGKAWADALPVNAAGQWGAGAPAYCRVRVPPFGQAEEGKPFFQLVMAHETFHCFQFVLMSAWRQRTAWLIEGMADWAAVTIYPTTAAIGAGPYNGYLGSPSKPLFGRSYDATGFWAHADEVGGAGSLWAKIPTILATPDDPAAYTAAGGAASAFVDTWASAFWRFTGAGAPWHQTLPYDIPFATLKVPASDITGGTTLGSNPYQTTVFNVTKDPDRPLVNVLGTEGGIRAGTNKGDYGIVQNDWFCLGKCKCPKGLSGQLPGHHKVPTSGLALALTGGAVAGGALVSYHPLEQFCKKKQPPDGPGESNGDPHLTTLDGLHFDFQAAGEFVLVRSPSGDLEIQARQQPWEKLKTVTLNTQLAMRVDGHRVTVVPGPTNTAPPVVRIDGAAAALPAGAVAGAGQGTVSRDGDGENATVTWPDGSNVVVRSVGKYGVAARFAIAEERRGQIAGLLGNFDDAPGNDLADRSGKPIAYHVKQSDGWGFLQRFHIQEEYEDGFFDRLYGNGYGDAWRIKQADSLFDYAAGETTKTFTDRSVPTKPVDPSELDAARRAAAEQRCRERGVTDPGPLEDCITDVALTGEDAFADDALAAQEAAHVAWHKLTAGARLSSFVSLLERADGSLHIAFDDLPASGFRMVNVPLDAAGHEGTPELIEGLSGEPRLFTGPAGGVRAVGSVIPSSDPSGTYEYIRGEDGTWTRLGPVMTEGFTYVGRPESLVLGDGTQITISPTNGHTRLYRGTGASNKGVPVPPDPSPCASTSPALAADGATGALYLAWVQWDCPDVGLFVEQVDPATLAPMFGPAKVPDSTWTAADGTTRYADTTSLDERLAFTGRPGQPGVYLAFAAGEPKRVRLWHVGDPSSTIVASRKIPPAQVALAAEPSGGRLWVGWTENDRLLVKRTTADAVPVDPLRTLGTPLGVPVFSSHHWDIAARTDALDVVYSLRRDGETPGGLWQTRVTP